ncbi:MAG: nucleotidyl transferase AbiEii/AbiGii toxin family protein [Spirochaetales bacterium]|nr:nucleotidyl transferase AbiEii/AbiGii toxin family protein [Spirochaetales bacterium]
MIEKKNFGCLLPETVKVLRVFIEQAPFLSNYVLVGGSALALHLCHRKSEDLDFFTFSDSYDKQEIIDFLNNFKTNEIINETKDQIDLLCDGVKVTFFNAKWEFLKPPAIEQCNIASIESIAAMKMNVLFLRAKYRDYYDLYFIAKEEMALNKIFEHAKGIIDGLTYKLFCIALTYIDDIEDDSITHLDPKEIVSKEEIRAFFEKRLVL